MRWMLGLLVLAAFAGCLDDSNGPDEAGDLMDASAHGSAWHPAAVRADGFNYSMPTGFGDVSAHTLGLGGGQGIWLHEDLLLWTNGADLHVVDNTDPAAPALLGTIDGISGRDVDVLEWQGRTYAVVASNNPEMHLVDITDPSAPEFITTTQSSIGVHNLAAVPGTPYVYISGAGGVEVVDFTTPAEPAFHMIAIPATMDGTPINSDGCHDISVRVDLQRAYCAGGGGQYLTGGGETFIWDISNEAGGVLDPTWVSFLDDPRVVYNHQAFVNADGTRLIVDDEFIAPNCLSADLPGVPNTVDPKIPFAAAWVWDISDETNPSLMGFVQNDAITRYVAGLDVGHLPQVVNCGSHFGDIVPGQDAFVMGWYGGGTMLVDFTDGADPQILDYTDATGSTWDARVHRGRVYHASGDLLVTPLV